MSKGEIKFASFAFACALLISCEHLSLNKEEAYAYYGDERLVLIKQYYEKSKGGGVRSERTFLEAKDSLIHGFGKLYFENGNLKYFANLHHGLKIGSVWEYHMSGNIKKYWFYNPLGQAIYGIQFDDNGNVVKEEGIGQRMPQVITKDLPDKKVSLKVYSASIPKHSRKMYLISPLGIPIDSVIDSQKPFDVFEISIDTGYFKVKVDYYNFDLVASDSISFKLE